MPNTFTCCELVKKIKTHQSQSNWKAKHKYLANEFLFKAAYEDFCKECKKWFMNQANDEQMKLIEAEIEKDKSKGKDFFTKYSNEIKEGSVMDEAMRIRNEVRKNSSLGDNSPPFGKSPQE